MQIKRGCQVVETWVNRVWVAETEWRQLKRNVAAGGNLEEQGEEEGLGGRGEVATPPQPPPPVNYISHFPCP